MNVLILLIIGSLAGIVFSRYINKRALQETVYECILGMIGAISTGFVFQIFGQSFMSIVGIITAITAWIGAMVIIFTERKLSVY